MIHLLSYVRSYWNVLPKLRQHSVYNTEWRLLLPPQQSNMIDPLKSKQNMTNI